ncbi:aminotransferase-like domain-containing protein [Novosphingobium gossypii]|uniref:aminotransferase-like domain-containing protein n=1 Tax=Novosphingobium gossypii TaxID=1604774 RepID=UPI003D222210
MQSWIPDISGSQSPKYLAIAEALLRDVEASKLVPGMRLPPQRTLADALGVDLTTITRAYGEAQRLGLIESDGRRGSFVRERRTSEIRPQRVDSGMNAPPELAGGLLSAEFRRSTDQLLGASDALALQYQPRGGMPAAREAGARLLSGRGMDCLDDSIVVTAGGQHALHAIFSAELRPGDVLAVPPFVYPGLLALARRFGVALRVLPLERDGIDPEALDDLCKHQPVRGLYLVPTNDNPTTVTTSLAKRQAIAQVAERHGLLIIEDDAYGFLPDDPLPPIASMAAERTWHIASVSKILSPGLRVAWLRAPGVAQAWRLAADLHETAVMAPPLNAAIVSQWVNNALFPRLVDEVRREAHWRQQLVARILPPSAFWSQQHGYHLWVPLETKEDERQVADALQPHGLSVIGSSAFAAVSEDPAAAVRVSLGGTLERDQLGRALRLLGALLEAGGTQKMSIV